MTAAVSTGWSAVHCGSASACTVVGSWTDSASNQYTLAEEWNGSTWTQDTTPSPTSGSTTGDGLGALSCTPGTSVCTAVGFGGSSVVFGIRN